MARGRKRRMTPSKSATSSSSSESSSSGDHSFSKCVNVQFSLDRYCERSGRTTFEKLDQKYLRPFFAPHASETRRESSPLASPRPVNPTGESLPRLPALRRSLVVDAFNARTDSFNTLSDTACTTGTQNAPPTYESLPDVDKTSQPDASPHLAGRRSSKQLPKISASRHEYSSSIDWAAGAWPSSDKQRESSPKFR